MFLSALYSNPFVLSKDEYDERKRKEQQDKLDAINQIKFKQFSSQIEEDKGHNNFLSKVFNNAVSGETFFNSVLPGNPGSAVRDAIEDIPIVGKPAGWLADSLTSPLSLATMGFGGAIGGAAAKGAFGVASKPLSAAFSPALTGGIGRRVLGETAATVGAGLGFKAAQQLPEMPGPINEVAELGAGFLGGGAGIKAAGGAFGGAPEVLAARQTKFSQQIENMDLPTLARMNQVDTDPEFMKAITDLDVRMRRQAVSEDERNQFESIRQRLLDMANSDVELKRRRTSPLAQMLEKSLGKGPKAGITTEYGPNDTFFHGTDIPNSGPLRPSMGDQHDMGDGFYAAPNAPDVANEHAMKGPEELLAREARYGIDSGISAPQVMPLKTRQDTRHLEAFDTVTQDELHNIFNALPVDLQPEFEDLIVKWSYGNGPSGKRVYDMLKQMGKNAGFEGYRAGDQFATDILGKAGWDGLNDSGGWYKQTSFFKPNEVLEPDLGRVPNTGGGRLGTSTYGPEEDPYFISPYDDPIPKAQASIPGQILETLGEIEAANLRNWSTEDLGKAMDDLDLFAEQHQNLKSTTNWSEMYDKLSDEYYNKTGSTVTWTNNHTDSYTGEPIDKPPVKGLIDELGPFSDEDMGFTKPDIGGGATNELVDQQIPKAGLTASERVRNLTSHALRFLDSNGVIENEVATPISREFARQAMALGNQATLWGNTAVRATSAFKPDKQGLTQFGVPIQDIALNFSKYKSLLDDEQLTVMERLKATAKKFESAMQDYGVKYNPVTPLDPEGFYLPRGGDFDTFGHLGQKKNTTPQQRRKRFPTMKQAIDQGYEYPKFEDAIREYGHGVAHITSQKWLGDTLQNIELPVGPKGSRRINVKGNKSKMVPVEFADVIERQLRRFGNLPKDDFTRLQQAVNSSGKAVWASADASWMGIQGLITLVESPRVALKAMKVGWDSITDKGALDKFVQMQDDLRRAEGKPISTDWARSGLHNSGLDSRGLDFSLNPEDGALAQVGKLPVLQQANRMFSVTGDAARRMLADLNFDIISSKRGTTKASFNLEKLAADANRATGYSSADLGGIADAVLFAPRYLTSQIELLVKAATDGDIEGELARRHLARLLGAGIGLTFLLNEARGEDTEPNPLDSNFLKIRNVKGNDVSVFGPWDSLVRGLVRTGKDRDPVYMLRSKASPLVSMTWDLLSGEDIFGEETRTPMGILQSLLPFSARDVVSGEGDLTSNALGFIGTKSSPISNKEELENALQSAGISKSDPDYLIKRRDFLRDNPDKLPDPDSSEGRFIRGLNDELGKRESLNEERTKSGEQGLVEFRTNRKMLNKEKRDRLAEVVKDIDPSSDSKQDKWVTSYFDLYDQVAKDEVTGDIDGDAFDTAEAAWIAKNGSQAYSFMQRYLMSGQNEVEKAYLEDIKVLSDAGYFNMSKLRNMKSDLTEDEIFDLRDKVSSARATDEKLSKLDFDIAARRLLRSAGYEAVEINDVIRAGKEFFQSPDYKAFKKEHKKELLWFNPKVSWEDYSKINSQ